jgi:uncharacterized protein (TIGR00369 family)
VSLRDNNRCFACGKANPIGLKLDFRQEGDSYVADFTPQEAHQGYAGITHGGIVATLLDEAMAKLAWASGLNAVTARLSVNYKKPAPVGEKMTVRGRIRERNRRLCKCSAELVGEDGDVIADAESTLVITEG